ncbi:MAG: hypothetical protein NTX91_02695 [candidate division SR1 bacterium]|nr:hypothetical protein [candidate division SR1 bacterium]
MKKLFITFAIFAACMAASSNSFGQITDLYVTKDSTVIIDKIYAGVLAGGQFRTDTVSNDAFVTARLGAMGSWRPTKWFAFRTWGIYDLNLANSFTLEQCWIDFTPSKKLSIQGGYMATLATEQRPNPATGDGQFETFGEAQIPGGTYNIKIEADNLGKFGFGACLAYRVKGLEYQAMFKYSWLKISGWRDYNGKFGSAMTLDLSRVYNVTSWRQDQVIANFLCVKMGKNKDYQLYSDNGYDLQAHKLVRSETGFLKTFSSTWIKGLFGLGYRYETRSINGYLFVHL